MRQPARTFSRVSLLLLACQAGCGLVAPVPPQHQAAMVPASQQPAAWPQNDSTAVDHLSIHQAHYLQPPVDAIQATVRAPTLEAELTVDAVVEEVLARNPTLAQMVAAWQAASARYPQVTSLEDPAFDVAVAPASIGSNNVDFGYRVGISQKFPLGGKLGLRGQVALADASAAGNEVQDTRLQLIESARMAFYDYYVVLRAQAVSDESLKLLQEARRSAENRVGTGKANQQEVIQIDVEIGRQGERVLNLARMRQVAVARLNTLMHRPPDSPLPPPPSKLSLPTSLPPIEALRARALELRPDLRALADRIKADESSLALARKEFYPDLMVGAAYDTIMGNGPTRDLAPQLSVGVNIPLRLDKRNTAVSEAQAKIMQRRAELARLTDQVQLQVEEAYAQVVEAEKVVRLYEKTILPAAENNNNAARNAYIPGQIPLVSYLEAQRTFVGLRDRYYQGLADYFQRRAALERAVGEPLLAALDRKGG
jgi:cobalt-zinc-cadmium efflux system outer membrane protein